VLPKQSLQALRFDVPFLYRVMLLATRATGLIHYGGMSATVAAESSDAAEKADIL